MQGQEKNLEVSSQAQNYNLPGNLSKFLDFLWSWMVGFVFTGHKNKVISRSKIRYLELINYVIV